MYIYKSL